MKQIPSTPAASHSSAGMSLTKAVWAECSEQLKSVVVGPPSSPIKGSKALALFGITGAIILSCAAVVTACHLIGYAFTLAVNFIYFQVTLVPFYSDIYIQLGMILVAVVVGVTLFTHNIYEHVITSINNVKVRIKS